MTFNRSIRTSDAKKERARELRTQGYDDGYAGRPAALSLLVYQQSYRRGQAARQGRRGMNPPMEHRTCPLCGKSVPIFTSTDRGVVFCGHRRPGAKNGINGSPWCQGGGRRVAA